MIARYYSLVGGAVNEAFARIDVLRSAALSSSPGLGLPQTRLVNARRDILVFLAKVARHRHQANQFEHAAPMSKLS